MHRNALHDLPIASPATNFFMFSSATLFNSSLASPSLYGLSYAFLHRVPSTITTTPPTTIPHPNEFSLWVDAWSCIPILASEQFLASFV
ncbi:hypothetical protein SDJN03_03149, partial [Cucurbita argyrosperma subsp. sororia]